MLTVAPVASCPNPQTHPPFLLSLYLLSLYTGNPSTDSEYDNEGRLDYWWSHALISEDIRRWAIRPLVLLVLRALEIF